MYLSTYVGRPDTNTTPIDNTLPRKPVYLVFQSYDSSTHLLVNNVFVIFIPFFYFLFHYGVDVSISAGAARSSVKV